MRATVAGEFSASRLALPADVGEAVAFAKTVVGRSQIVWGEHCSECAYPKCYASCAFYDPRPDLHCRRFENGIEAVDGCAGARFSRIRFLKWGKLEGRGPVRRHTPREALWRERADGVVSRTLAVPAAPFAVQRNLAWRWDQAKSRAPEPAEATPAFDAFVVEGWSRDGRERGFTLTIVQDEPRRTLFQTHFTLGARYARLSVPIAEIAAQIALDHPFLIQIEPVGEAEGVDVLLGLVDFVALEASAKAATAPAPQAGGKPPLVKVLVWDLDETLWTGTLVEDGAAGVKPRPEAVAALKALDARGVLHSIASKNDAAEAMAALRLHGLDDYFLHPQVSWEPKSEAIGRIAAALDLGVDSFVFVDDQPFERAEVQARYPQCRVMEHTEVAAIPTHPWFDQPETAEGAGRRALYRSEAGRAAAFDATKTDYIAFLRESELVLTIAPLSRAEVTRVFELSQRTNQLNFTGAKLTRDAVERMAEDDGRHARLVLRCADKFGDYGLIGFAEIDLEAGALTTFFMSCRVQRKRVEHAFFAHAAALLSARERTALRVDFKATERNGASVRMLTDLGFEDGGGAWTRDLARPFDDSDVVRIAPSLPRAA